MPIYPSGLITETTPTEWINAMELDLTEAIEAARETALDTDCACGFEANGEGHTCVICPARAAVRAAAPIIERAVREADEKLLTADRDSWRTLSKLTLRRLEAAEAERDALLPVVEAARRAAVFLKAAGCHRDNAWFTDEAKGIVAAVDLWESRQ